LSQQLFADRLGKSKSWVDKIERGIRTLDRFSTMSDIANVLGVDVSLLLGREQRPPAASPPGTNDVEIQRIRAALEQYDRLNILFAPRSGPPDLTELRKALRHAWLSFQRARYGVLARALPDLLQGCQVADAAYTGDDGRRASHLLSQVYQIASSTLRKLGEPELSWLAADRAMLACRRAEDRMLAGCATFRIGCALAESGRARAALEVNVNAAQQLFPTAEYARANAKELSVYGLLLLQGAMAAARIGDTTTTTDLLHGADDAAQRLGGDRNEYWTSFGPTNVKLHRVAAAVELGDGRRAVDEHASITPDRIADLMPERRAQHFLDVARAYLQIGDPRRAGEMLLEGDRWAPGELRFRPPARRAMEELLRRVCGGAPTPLADLAHSMGVTV